MSNLAMGKGGVNSLIISPVSDESVFALADLGVAVADGVGVALLARVLLFATLPVTNKAKFAAALVPRYLIKLIKEIDIVIKVEEAITKPKN